jgi:hypothetical protein
MPARIYSHLCWNYSATNVAPLQKDRHLPLVEENPPLIYMYMSGREQKSWSCISTEPEAKNYCAGAVNSNSTDRQFQILLSRVSKFIFVQEGNRVGSCGYSDAFLGARGSVVVEALCYKPKVRGIASRWSGSFRSHCGPGVDSSSNRNEYQES